MTIMPIITANKSISSHQSLGSHILHQIRFYFLRFLLRLRYGRNTTLQSQEEFVADVRKQIRKIYNERWQVSIHEDPHRELHEGSEIAYPAASSYEKE